MARTPAKTVISWLLILSCCCVLLCSAAPASRNKSRHKKPNPPAPLPTKVKTTTTPLVQSTAPPHTQPVKETSHQPLSAITKLNSGGENNPKVVRTKREETPPGGTALPSAPTLPPDASAPDEGTASTGEQPPATASGTTGTPAVPAQPSLPPVAAPPPSNGSQANATTVSMLSLVRLLERSLKNWFCNNCTNQPTNVR